MAIENKKKIAILCPVHSGRERVVAQLENYQRFHGNSAFHVLHPSIESGQTFTDIQREFSGEVIVCDSPWPTSFRCIFGSILSNNLHLSKLDRDDWDTIYLHTDADLLISGHFLSTVRKFDHGFAAIPLNPKWGSYQRYVRDHRFSRMISELGIKNAEVLFGRQEGSFFSRDLWERMMAIAYQFFPKESFEDKDSHWPVEEVFFPTVARWLLGDDVVVARPLVRTKEPKKGLRGNNRREFEENHVQVADIKEKLDSIPFGTCFGLKWFSPDLDHSSRRFLTKKLNSEIDIDKSLEK